MRFCLRVWAVTALWLVMFSTGTAHADVPRTADGNAVMAGSGDAPAQLEIFCEPQCPHCAELESTYGDRVAGDLASGRLAVTYRWLTFLDDKHHNDVSARVTNALFLAADPSTSPTAYQAFVQDLYRHQSQDGPNNNDIAAMARESGIPRGGGRPDRCRRVCGRYRRAQRRQQSTTRSGEPGKPWHPNGLRPQGEQARRHSRPGLAGRLVQLTVQPFVHQRKTPQRGRGDQPAGHRDGSGPGTMASLALRCCTRTRLGLSLSYST